MSSFSCPHQVNDQCKRVRKACKPGMEGCVLKGKVVFAPEETLPPSRAGIMRKAKNRRNRSKE